MDITFFVAGIPAPKGSLKAFPIRHKDGRMSSILTNANSKTKPWEDSIKLVAMGNAPTTPSINAISIDCTFKMLRPKSVRPSKRLHCITRPDLDKLLRTVLDALTGIFFADDSQVISLVAGKEYSDSCGVEIKIKEIE
jgi:crossover junction endodeoxyribonuclease RusA